MAIHSSILARIIPRTGICLGLQRVRHHRAHRQHTPVGLGRGWAKRKHSHGGLGARGHIRTLTEGPPKAEPVGHRAGLATGLHASLPDSDCECQTPSGAPSVTQWDTRDHLARRWAELPFAQYTQPLLSTTIPQGAPDRCPQGVLMTLESSRRPGKGGRVGVSQDFGIL